MFMEESKLSLCTDRDNSYSSLTSGSARQFWNSKTTMNLEESHLSKYIDKR